MDSGDYTYEPVQLVDRLAHLEAQVKELIAWQASMTQLICSGSSQSMDVCANVAPDISQVLAPTHRTNGRCPSGEREPEDNASVAIGKSDRQRQRQRQVSKGGNLAMNLRIFSQEMWRLGFPTTRTWDANRMLTLPTSSQAALKVGLSYLDLQKYAYRLVGYSDIWYAKKNPSLLCECGAVPMYYAGFRNMTSGGTPGFGGLWVCEECAEVMDATDDLTILVEMATVKRYAVRGKSIAGRDANDDEDEEG